MQVSRKQTNKHTTQQNTTHISQHRHTHTHTYAHTHTISFIPGCGSCMNSNSLLATVLRNFQCNRRKRGYCPTTNIMFVAITALWSLPIFISHNPSRLRITVTTKECSCDSADVWVCVCACVCDVCACVCVWVGG